MNIKYVIFLIQIRKGMYNTYKTLLGEQVCRSEIEKRKAGLYSDVHNGLEIKFRPLF